MNKHCEICITSTAENALKRLKKAEIPVFNCKKQGAYFIFGVKDKDIKKVFAIFAKPCYNVTILRQSGIKRIFSFAALRAGLLVGALIFIAAAFVSDFFVLRIEVTGSGSYLESEVVQIVSDEGAGYGSRFSALNTPVATGRILSLPQVVFCDISKRGSVLVVDVQVENSQTHSVARTPLISDVSGKVVNIVAICGTAAVEADACVVKGDVLIYPHTVIAEQNVDCLAIGYAEIECSRTAEYFAPDDSENSIREAYASLLLDGDEVISVSHKIHSADGGVRIVMNVKYMHKISINLT